MSAVTEHRTGAAPAPPAAPAAPRPRVVVVAQAAPARGGISTFASTLVAEPRLSSAYEMVLLNTCRTAERRAGTWSLANARHAVQDAVRTHRAARGADVVHVQTALMPVQPLLRALALCLAGRLGGAAVLCHVHSGRVNSGRAEAFSPRPHERLLLRGLRVASAVLTVSRPGADALRPLLGGTPVEPVDNAVAVAGFDRAPLRGDPPTVVYVGTLSRRKGLADLVTALELLQERGGPSYCLEVVGGSHEVGEQEADELRTAVSAVAGSACLLGSLDADQVRERLRRADVFVLPSHWEGQPIAILEAMATGLPVLVTAVGANPDVVRDGVDGLVVPPHDPTALAEALDRLLTDAPLRRRLGASARERAAAHHDVAQLADRMSSLYARAAGS